MNILLIHQFFLPPGEAGGARWNELTRLWAGQGHSITVLAGMVHYGRGRKYDHCRGRWVVEEHPQPGVRVIRTHVSGWYNRHWPGRLWGYLTFLFSAGWAAALRARGPYEVVLLTSPPLLLGVLGLAVARWKRVPLVTEIRDLWPDAPVELGILKHRGLVRLAYALERWLYRHSARIVALTPAFRTVLLERKGVPADRVAVLPNAADFRLTDPLLPAFDRLAFGREHGLKEPVFRVIYAGAHGRANGLANLLAVARLLRTEPVEFLLVGDGMEKQALVRRAAEWRLTNVHFLDGVPREEAFRYLLASDLSIVTMQPQPIFRTMYANKMFEAMAAQKPVLTTLDGITRQLIERVGAGTYVEPDNLVGWAETIREYLRCPEKGVREGRQGYACVKEQFDRETIARQYLRLIQDVSAGR